MTSISNIWKTVDLHFVKSESFSLTWSCGTRQRDTTSSGWKFSLNNLAVKGVVNCQNSRDKGPPDGNSAVGTPRPYSIIILNMRFIPKASLRASSQIPASSYILERHLWVNNSKLFALTPTWSLACKQTDCITGGGVLKLLDLKLVLTCAGGLSLKHCTFIQCWFNVGPPSQTLA